MFKLSLALTIIASVVAGPASAQSRWYSEYSSGKGAGQITSCNAGIIYRDGAFLARIHSEELDFFFYFDEFSLPPNQELGSVAMSFKSQDFVLSAWSTSEDSSGKTASLILAPSKDNYSEILGAMRFAESFRLTFPDGTNYTISLVGSDAALKQAFQCWTDNYTGSAGKNPFSGGASVEGSNPFN